ncbi:MAG TPA: hypothetical protein VFP80_18285 [Thermoanaerobaculia bacterium]|nr:hypothetical protein [Thermoanaerobaculia bacterium]
MSVAADAGHEQRRPLPLLRTILEVAVVVVFVFLIWNNFALRRQQSRTAAAAKSSRGFVVRDQIGVIPATMIDGRRNDLDLRNSRGIIAIVNPTCESCRELVASAHNAPDVHVLAYTSPAEAAAQAKNLGPAARYLPQNLGGALGDRLRIYPQVLVIDHGEIVRTCARLEECR